MTSSFRAPIHLKGHAAVAALMLTAGSMSCNAPEHGDEIENAHKPFFRQAEGPFPREGECNIDDPLFDDVRALLGPDNNIGPDTLKNTPVPEPSNLEDFVRDRATAIALGKALFWDMQVGSDGIQSCATCHFRAGADPRSKNQVAPGGAAQDHIDLRGANATLTANDFPLHRLADPRDRASAVLHTVDDIISSQGVVLHDFDDAARTKKFDDGSLVPDPVFNVSGANTRRVEPRNTPTVVNAVFNTRNFWDGRAEFFFNGVNPFGARDPDARVLRAEAPDQPELVTLRIDNASLASQAVGPPESNSEMGYTGRHMRDVGKRLVGATPLRKQLVHPDDSVLGPLTKSAIHSSKGLDTTYGALVAQAFEPKWWDSNKIVVVAPNGTVSFEHSGPGSLGPGEFTMMEYNFSLFFGLAIQMYESTLVTDDARIDQHFDDIALGGPGILDEQELHGMELFEQAACADCHSGPEFTSASVRASVTGFDNLDANPVYQPPEQVERMFIGSCEVAVYDQGFYNIGVRPFEEDLGIGALDPFGNPLSAAVLLTADPNTIPSQELLSLNYPNLGDLGIVPPFAIGERTAVLGGFKIPSLRNVALTAPYFHSGGHATLRQVVEFYNRGGDFHDHIGPGGIAQDEFMDLGIGRLELNDAEIDALVAFLETLTDARLLAQVAPFDHPELIVPIGHVGDEASVDAQHGGLEATTEFLTVPEVGAAGGPAPAGFLE